MTLHAAIGIALTDMGADTELSAVPVERLTDKVISIYGRQVSVVNVDRRCREIGVKAKNGRRWLDLTKSGDTGEEITDNATQCQEGVGCGVRPSCRHETVHVVKPRKVAESKGNSPTQSANQPPQLELW